MGEEDGTLIDPARRTQPGFGVPKSLPDAALQEGIQRDDTHEFSLA